jgi:hypothetical protein
MLDLKERNAEICILQLEARPSTTVISYFQFSKKNSEDEIKSTRHQLSHRHSTIKFILYVRI